MIERIKFDVPEELDEKWGDFWVVYIKNGEIYDVWKQIHNEEIPPEVYIPFKGEILNKALK